MNDKLDKRFDWERRFDASYALVFGEGMHKEAVKTYIWTLIEGALSRQRAEFEEAIKGMKKPDKYEKGRPFRDYGEMEQLHYGAKGYNKAIDDVLATLRQKMKKI